MKRELTFALKAQTQLNCGSLGRTRSSKPQFSPSSGNSRDDVAGTSQCDNGGIYVHSSKQKRFKKSKIDVAVVATSSRRITRSALKTIQVDDCGSVLEVTSAVTSALEDVKEVQCSGDEVIKSEVVLDLSRRRFTRSALKSKEVEMDDDLKLDDDDDLNENVLETPTKKLELKMTKKIELTGRITTVRELFETGLLEGLPIFYDYEKDDGTKLRGVIKGIGILCSCSLCKGSRVILPSQFEFHACKAYKRASQYFCLENGKSLFELLEICKSSVMGTLEETIRTVIGHLPGNKLSRTPKSAEVSGPLTSASLPAIRPRNSELKRKRNSLGLALTPSADRSASEFNVLQEKVQRMKKKVDIIPRSLGRASISSLSPSKKKTAKRVLRSASVPRFTTSTSSEKKSKWKITKKDLNMHRLVFESNALPEGAELRYFGGGKKLLTGYKRGSGILCHHCDTEVSASQFEVHAGLGSRKKPYQNIYISNGVSLHEYAIYLLKRRGSATKVNDDLCTICRDGGILLLCDGCPRAFHKECAKLPSDPRGKWYCNYCENMFQRESFVERNANAIAAGRVSGIDPIEEITKRCIRIVNNPENVAVACVLCRGYDFCDDKDKFVPTTAILCDQCQKEYHVGCLKKNKMANLKQLPEREWYCSNDCKKMCSSLKKLVKRGPQILHDNCMDVLQKKQINSGLDGITESDVRWMLLNGRILSSQNKSLLSEAVAIFHERFDPIIDAESGTDFIPAMIYCEDEIKGQNFGGMFTAVLTVNSVVVSAGILRIFGHHLAELPLVATSKCNQGKGYFQTLFSCIEKLLISLKVKRIILPSADEAKAIWIKKFGFKKLSLQQLAECRKECSAMVIFKGTSMLEKKLPVCEDVKSDDTASDISDV